MAVRDEAAWARLSRAATNGGAPARAPERIVELQEPPPALIVG
jgi:hypothetical protein